MLSFAGSDTADLDTGVGLRDQCPTPVKERDLVLLEQIQDAVVVLLDDRVFSFKHFLKIKAQAFDFYAMIGKRMACVLKVLGRLQQRF